MGRKRLDPAVNWWSKVDQRGNDECWPWLAGCDRDGYGKFAVGLGGHRQRHVSAHRFGYELLVGPIPDGQVVCHSCDNPPCCNPAHWFLGTPRENNDDKVAKGRHAKLWGTPLRNSRKTHCRRGHELTPQNTRIYIRGGHEQRRCKSCEPINTREWYHKHRK
jgi:hypothetical protein